jgi:heme-degrading monooxygenase HmoA
MIMRIYRCTVVDGKEAEFREYAFKSRHPWLKERAGLIAFYAGRPLLESASRDRCMVQLWESADAIEAVLGQNWRQTPVLPEEARGIVETASVEHYVIADEFQAGMPQSGDLQ